ncbi:MAG: hypothetical protein ACRDYV_06880, partial [Acidimicrobiia bacterium]
MLLGVAALAALVVTLQLGGGASRDVPAGLPDAGAVARWGLPVSVLAADLAGMLAVGHLVVAGVLLAPGTPAPRPFAQRAVRAAAFWLGLLSLAGAVRLVLTASDITGRPLGDLGP